MQKIKLIKTSSVVVALLVLVSAALSILVQHSDYIPVWDAGWYYACIFNAVEAPFQLRHFNCVGHVSVTYIAILALFQHLGPGQPYWLFLGNFSLLCLAAISFYFLVKSFNGLRQEYDQFDISDALATICFITCPPIIANLFHINLDFGVMIFSLCTLLALRSGNCWMAALCGTLMVFSKEIGLPLYGGLILVGESFFTLKERPRFNTRKSWLRLFILGLPIALYLVRIVRRLVLYPEQSLFYTEQEYHFAEKSAVDMFLDFNIFEATFRTYLFDIFIFQFNWIFTISAIISVFVLLKRRLIQLNDTWKTYLSLAFFLIGTVYLVSRHRPFNHIRYVLPALPIYFLFCYALMKQALPRLMTRSILAVISGLFLCSQLRSFDPLSVKYFGMVSLGDYSVYNMARHFFTSSPNRASFNRDELAYNLQFMYPLRAAQLAIKEISPDGHTTFMGSSGSKFYWPDFIEEGTFHRVGRRSGSVFKAHYFDTIRDFANVHNKPNELAFIEFPQFYSAGDLADLDQWYTKKISREVKLDGYRVNIHYLNKKLLSVNLIVN